MATTTANLSLIKPEIGDNITPDIFANNFDAIDEALRNVNVQFTDHDADIAKVNERCTTLSSRIAALQKITSGSILRSSNNYIVDAYSGNNNADKVTGTVICNTLSTTQNLPKDTDGWGTLIPLITGGARGIQIFMAWNSTRIYVRTLNGNIFSEWKCIYDKNKYPILLTEADKTKLEKILEKTNE